MKIVTYNVNGIRSVMAKGWADWLRSVDADVVCLQETKALPEQVDVQIFEKMGYKHYWHSAQKKGYSGVCILTKQIPTHVETGCGIKDYDSEGRVLRADYGEVSVLCVYIPSGSSGEERQAYKMQWISDFKVYIDKLKKKRKKLIICGDYNICHRAIDIHNPVSNAKSSGFLPEEREWMEQFINSGFIDTFRHFNKDPHHYTWWTYRFSAREKNLGWRIDYTLASDTMAGQLVNCTIMPGAKHSDHCPVLLEIKL